MTKFEEMQAKLASLIAAMQSHIDKDELDKAENVKNEIVALRQKMDEQAFLDSLELPKPTSIPTVPADDSAKENANFIRACIKKFSGRNLTAAENALLLPTGTGQNPDGEHGESYILPEDLRTKIHKRIRELRSLRTVCGYLSTRALSGSYPIENLDSLTGLVDFSDGNELTDSTDFGFEKVSFTLKEKGALITLSNTLLALSDNDLTAYVINIFAKKAVITENAMIISAITAGKTEKVLADWSSLKASINVDLDPGVLYGTVIVTNQDGFNYLDTALDNNGRPILQPDPTNPTKKMFAGFPVHVFSNAAIPSSAPTTTTDGYAPVYYGNLEEGVKLVELDAMSFATSKEAGFTRNVTLARCIEFIDVVQQDASDKCYCVGKFKIADKTRT